MRNLESGINHVENLSQGHDFCSYIPLGRKKDDVLLGCDGGNVAQIFFLNYQTIVLAYTDVHERIVGINTLYALGSCSKFWRNIVTFWFERNGEPHREASMKLHLTNECVYLGKNLLPEPSWLFNAKSSTCHLSVAVSEFQNGLTAHHLRKQVVFKLSSLNVQRTFSVVFELFSTRIGDDIHLFLLPLIPDEKKYEFLRRERNVFLTFITQSLQLSLNLG